VLRRFWNASGAPEELSGANLEDLEQLIVNRSGGKKILLPGSWQALYSYDKLILFSEDNARTLQQDDGWSCAVDLTGLSVGLSDGGSTEIEEIPFPDHRVAQISVIKERPAYQYRTQMAYPLARLKCLGNTLVFRYRQPGDRIFPLKGTGHKTLKKYLIECRVPVEERNRLVVAAAGNEIVWIPGLANARWEEQNGSSEVPAREQGWLFININ
jgi:tRNA(Ile)-lysidine synthase